LVAVVGVLGADDGAGGLVGVGLEDLLLAVVLADDVEEVGEAVVVVVGDVGAEETLGDGAGAVVLVEGVDEGFEDGDGDVGFGGVVDFIAGGLEDDAGVIAVALDGVGGVAEGPLLEVEVVVVGVFGDGPAVEHLVHDEEAHAVAEVEELRRGWVVGGADCVDTKLAELGEAAGAEGEGYGGAYGSCVGVEGYAVDLVVGAVEEEALVGVEVKLADADGQVFVIDGAAFAHEGSVDSVEGGVDEVPTVGIWDFGLGVEIEGGAWCDGDGGRGEKGLEVLAVRGDEADGEADDGRLCGLVDDAAADVDGGGGGRDGRGGDEGAQGRDVGIGGGDDADVAVDAGAGVPAGGGLLGVVDADGEGVDAGVELLGDVVVEADVAVGAMAEELAVEVDVGVGMTPSKTT